LSGIPRAKEEALRKQCVNNLKAVGLAFHQSALDSYDRMLMHYPSTQGGSLESITNGEVYLTYQAMSNLLSAPSILVCPTDNRAPPSNFLFSLSNTNVSYFVGVDAVDTYPQMLLSGDRNITNGVLPPNRVLTLTANTPGGYTHELHKRRGNVCLADGSVQSASGDAILRKMVVNSGMPTNRLAMP
jgi:prepilin-type processing-associated H-X9-DG protein